MKVFLYINQYHQMIIFIQYLYVQKKVFFAIAFAAYVTVAAANILQYEARPIYQTYDYVS